jgi:hypothetical protein
VTTPIERNEGYNWKLDVDPKQASEFRNSTKLLGRFRPAQTNEEFDAYVLTQ